MTGLILKFLLENWKAIVGTLFALIFAWVVHDYTTLRERIKGKEEIIKQLEAKFDKLEELSDLQKDKLDRAEVERSRIMSKMAKDINILINQKPPKECNEAIVWAIKNKGDIQWPK